MQTAKLQRQFRQLRDRQRAGTLRPSTGSGVFDLGANRRKRAQAKRAAETLEARQALTTTPDITEPDDFSGPSHRRFGSVQAAETPPRDAPRTAAIAVNAPPLAA